VHANCAHLTASSNTNLVTSVFGLANYAAVPAWSTNFWISNPMYVTNPTNLTKLGELTAQVVRISTSKLQRPLLDATGDLAPQRLMNDI
jgi:hypothetical protein